MDNESRITELEIKASYLEDTVEQLNEVLVRQQREIDALIRELGEMKNRVPQADEPGFRSLRDELPPHY